MFQKTYIRIVYYWKRWNCLFFHLTLTLRLLAAEVLHEDDDHIGSGVGIGSGGGGGGGGDEENEEEEEVVVVEENSDSYISAMIMVGHTLFLWHCFFLCVNK